MYKTVLLSSLWDQGVCNYVRGVFLSSCVLARTLKLFCIRVLVSCRRSLQSASLTSSFDRQENGGQRVLWPLQASFSSSAKWRSPCQTVFLYFKHIEGCLACDKPHINVREASNLGIEEEICIYQTAGFILWFSPYYFVTLGKWTKIPFLHRTIKRINLFNIYKTVPGSW